MPTTNTRFALVTGANKGIGLEIARGLSERSYTVFLGARDRSRGEAAAQELAAGGRDIRVLELDITDAASIDRAAAEIAGQTDHLDVLVNNAGITAEGTATPETVPLDVVRKVYETNVFGAVAVTQACLPLLRRSPMGRIVNMSSSLGSLTRQNESPFVLLAYGSSKTALDGVTVQFANHLRDTSIKVNAACPGYVATDLNGHRGTRTPADGAAIAVRLATLPPDGPTGGFFDDAGAVPW